MNVIDLAWADQRQVAKRRKAVRPANTGWTGERMNSEADELLPICADLDLVGLGSVAASETDLAADGAQTAAGAIANKNIALGQLPMRLINCSSGNSR